MLCSNNTSDPSSSVFHVCVSIFINDARRRRRGSVHGFCSDTLCGRIDVLCHDGISNEASRSASDFGNDSICRLQT